MIILMFLAFFSELERPRYILEAFFKVFFCFFFDNIQLKVLYMETL